MDTIRDLLAGDWDEWLPLWLGYLDFYRTELSDETTEVTFERLCAGSDGMFAFLAVDDVGGGRGLAHGIVHPSTWSRRPSCYLEDLFVAPAARSSGLGRALIAQVKGRADARVAHHVYWHTRLDNHRARSLYDQVAQATDYMVYEL